MRKFITKSPEIVMCFVFWAIVVCAFLYTVATYNLEMLVPCAFVFIMSFGLGALVYFNFRIESIPLLGVLKSHELDVHSLGSRKLTREFNTLKEKLSRRMACFDFVNQEKAKKFIKNLKEEKKRVEFTLQKAPKPAWRFF